MDKKLLVLALIAYVFILVGCMGSSNLKVDGDYRSGTGALQLSFESITTSKMYENESGTIVVRAKNAGATTIESGKLVLLTDDSALFFGNRESYFDGSYAVNSKSLVKSNQYPLYGKSVMAPTGDEEVFTFPLYALLLPQESVQRTVKVVAVACFPYGTFQQSAVCMDFSSAYLGTTDSKLKPVCVAKDVSFKTGGGPVNVDAMQVRFDKQSDGEIVPTFTFTINSQSSAKIFSLGSEQAMCNGISSTLSNAAPNQITFKAVLSDRSLACEAPLAVGLADTYDVTLRSGTARITCTAPFAVSASDISVGNYMAPITVNMTYGAVVTVSKSIQINALQ